MMLTCDEGCFHTLEEPCAHGCHNKYKEAKMDIQCKAELDGLRCIRGPGHQNDALVTSQMHWAWPEFKGDFGKDVVLQMVKWEDAKEG